MAQECPCKAKAFCKAARPSLFLTALLLLVLSATGAQRYQGGEPLPFMLIDLQRRASAQLRAAESLTALLDGAESGRIKREDLEDFALQRLKLINDLSKDIEQDPNVRKLDLMRRGMVKEKSISPAVPSSTAEAREMISELTELTRQVKKQVSQIAEDRQSYEVNLEELGQPQIQSLCRQIRKLKDRLEDFFKGKR